MGDQIGGIFDRKADLIERLHQGPGEEARAISTIGPAGPTPSRWTLRKIRISIPWLRDYSLSGVWRLLRRLQIRLRSGQVQNYSPDPDYVPKVEHLLDVLRQVAQAPKDKVLVFVDEMGYLRWPEPAADWTEQAPAPAAVAERAKSRQQQWRVIGALNAWTAQVDYRDNYIVGREQVKAFLKQLDAAYPQAQTIYVVWDNWSIHQHEEVQQVLKELPRLEVVCLPTYAPWLNPIEKLWRKLRQDVLYLHRHAGDWKQMRQRIQDFLDQFASGSAELLRYVGLLGNGKLATALQVDDYRS